MFAQCPASPPAGFVCIPDSAFEAELIADGIDTNSTLDGLISEADALATGSLSLINAGISDLTGIEAFTNIINLDASYNADLTSVDLSNNTVLQTISFERATNLASLNISNCTLLQTLNCLETSFTSIDLSNNTNLTTINFRGCDLSGDLDLSNNNALTSIDVKTNNLTSLDVRGLTNTNPMDVSVDASFNPNLTCIFVDDKNLNHTLYWGDNPSTNYVETEMECNTLSLDGSKTVTFNMFPNPTKNTLNIELPNATQAKVNVYDITGKIVLNEQINNTQETLNVSGLNSGVYILQLETATGTSSKKLIIN